MKRILLLTLLLLVSAILPGQSFDTRQIWTTGYSAGSTDVAKWAVSLPNGDVLTVGTGQNPAGLKFPVVQRHSADGTYVSGMDYTGITGTVSNDTQALFAGLLPSGNLFIGCSRPDIYGTYFMVINLTNYAVVSSSVDYVTPIAYNLNINGNVLMVYNTGTSSSSAIVCREYTSAGTLLHEETYDESNVEDVAYSISPTSDGGCMIAGSKASDALLLKYDSSWQNEWVRTFTGGGAGFQIAYQALQASDGAFYIAGTDLAGSVNTTGMIIKTDADGTLLWINYPGCSLTSVALMADGNCVVGGWDNEYAARKPFLSIYDQNGGYLWGDVVYYYEESTIQCYGEFNMLLPISDTDFVAVGWVNNHSGTYNSDWTMKGYHTLWDTGVVITSMLPTTPGPDLPSEVSVMVSDTLHFSVDAYDPAGTPLSYLWMLMGEGEVSSTNSYDFVATPELEGQSLMVVLMIADSDQNILYYGWSVTVTPFVNPPLPPYPSNPYWDETYMVTDYAINSSPTLSWNYSSDETHTQDRSVLYFGTDLAGVTAMSASSKVQDDGTLQYSYTTTLVPNQTYYWRVVVYNGTQHTEGAVWSFTTEPVITTFPYLQGFENNWMLPSGWKNMMSSDMSESPIVPTMGSGWGFTGSPVHGGAIAANISCMMMPSYYFLTTPYFQVYNDSELRFWVDYNWTAQNPTQLYVRLLTATGWVTVKSFTSAVDINAFASEVVVPLGDYSGQTAKLAFVYNVYAMGSPVNLDDFSLIRTGSSINAPQNLTINIGNQVNLSWDADAQATGYRVYATTNPAQATPWTQISNGTGFTSNGGRINWSTPKGAKAFYKVTFVTD